MFYCKYDFFNAVLADANLSKSFTIILCTPQDIFSKDIRKMLFFFANVIHGCNCCPVSFRLLDFEQSLIEPSETSDVQDVLLNP